MKRWIAQDRHAGNLDLCFKTLVLALALFGMAGCQSLSATKPAPSSTGQALEASPATISFGEVQVGGKLTGSETLTNRSTSTITLSEANTSGSGFSVSGLTLPHALRAGESLTFTVDFAPTTAVGASGTIAIVSDASSPRVAVGLMGKGTTHTKNCVLAFSPSAISFGNVSVGTSQNQTVTLTASGAGVTIPSPPAQTGPFSISSPSFPIMLAKGQSIPLVVTFAPSMQGAVSQSLSLASDASNSPTVLNASGSGTSTTVTPGTLAFSPSSIAFGNVLVGTSQKQTLTLSASTASVTVASAPAPAGPFSISGLSFPITIAPGQSASLVVTFKPLTTGAASQSLSFGSDASNSPTVLNASGSGISAPPSFAHGMFILNPPSNDGNCAGTVSACYSQHVVPTLICTGPGTPAGYNCTQRGAGEPYVKGAIFYVGWDQVSYSNGSYDFSMPDNRARPWIDSGKLVSFDFIPTSQESSNNITPSWYLTPVNISTVSQTGGIITLQSSADMDFFPGGISSAAGLEVQIKGTGTALDGNGTSANPGIWEVCDHTIAGCLDPTSRTITAIGSGSDIAPVSKGRAGNPVYGTVNCGSGTLPIEWRPNFIRAWQNFIQQAVAHYASNTNVAYLRFGLGIGGENIPNHGTSVQSCQAEMTSYGFTGVPGFSAPWPDPGNLQWPKLSGPWISYLNTMLQYEHSLNSTKILGTTLSPIETSGGDVTTPDATAVTAVATSIGIGNQGLQKSDPVNFAAGLPCLGGNWCSNFVKYKGQVPLQVQTLYYSDPTDATAVGSLVHTLPFATSLGANILELYVDDWLCTYDSAWSGKNTFGECTAAGYAPVFAATAAQVN